MSLRFKVGELALLTNVPYPQMNNQLVIIDMVGPFPAGTVLEDNEGTVKVLDRPMDYTVMTVDHYWGAFCRDYQLVKLGEPPRQDLTETDQDIEEESHA